MTATRRIVGRPATAEYFEGIWRGADTILLGRSNYEGFHAVARHDPPRAHRPRTRDLGRGRSRSTSAARVARDGRVLPRRVDEGAGDLNSAGVSAPSSCAWTSSVGLHLRRS